MKNPNNLEFKGKWEIFVSHFENLLHKSTRQPWTAPLGGGFYDGTRSGVDFRVSFLTATAAELS